MLAQGSGIIFSLLLFVSGAEPTPTPSSAATPSAKEGEAAPDAAKPKQRLDLGIFSDPFGRIRLPKDGSLKSSDLPWFEDYIEVHDTAPRNIQELAADWWKHWNIGNNLGPPIGVPTHKDMLEQMPGTPPPTISFIDLANYLIMQLAQRAKRDSMPPIEMLPPPPPVPELRVEPSVSPHDQEATGNPVSTPTPSPM